MLFSGVATPAEAITVARAGGLGNEEIRDLLAESPVVAPGIRNRFQAVLEASGPTWWTTELGAKDARLATELVQAAGGTTRLHLGPIIRDPYQAAADAGLSDDDRASGNREGLSWTD